MGWLWSRLPIKAQNFEIEVEFSVSYTPPIQLWHANLDRGGFQVNGKGQSLFGDGFAVWLTTDRAQPGPVFGSIGKVFLALACTIIHV
jgi:mannose-binding lectin 2